MSDRFAKEVTNNQELIDFLISEFEVSETRAKELVVKHTSLIEEAKKRRAFIYYIGNQIADAEGLEPNEDEDEDLAYESDDL